MTIWFPRFLPSMIEGAIEMTANAAESEGKNIDRTMKPHVLGLPNGDHKVTLWLVGGDKFQMVVENEALYTYMTTK